MMLVQNVFVLKIFYLFGLNFAHMTAVNWI